MKKLIYIILSLFFLTITPSYASDNDKEEVKSFTLELGNKIMNISKDKSLSNKIRREKIVDIVDHSVDASWISRFVLGKNYRRFSEEEKSRFKTLYRNFMIYTYGPKFESFNVKEFLVLNIEKQKIFYVAKCEIINYNSSTPIDFDFRIRKRKGKYKVLDFVAEGVSLIETQRSEFNSAISNKGIKLFLDDLEKKIEDLKKNY